MPRPDVAQVVQDGPPRLVGYARISTDDQTTAPQADALTRAAVDAVFEEAASGANTARPVPGKNARRSPSGRYARGVAARSARPVARPSHRGRHHTARARRFLAIADRRVRHLDGFRAAFISRARGVAEFEREVIKERTVAGMKAAKKRGTHVGRPKALAGSRLAEAGRMLAAGKSQIETARILRVSRATIQRAYPGGRR